MELTLSHEEAAFRDEILQDTKAIRHRDRLVPGAEHRMVDMFIAHEEALSLMQHLTLSLAANEAGVSRLASGVKSKIGYAGKFVADQAVQLHGGMGAAGLFEIVH
jgi:alkylation response protein AidB-like acyl-CoA dehydrogenase